MLDSNGCLTTDTKSIVNSLQSNFSSVYSDPNSENIKLPHFTLPNIEQEMTDEDLVISDEDFLSAIKDIKPMIQIVTGRFAHGLFAQNGPPEVRLIQVRLG